MNQFNPGQMMASGMFSAQQPAIDPRYAAIRMAGGFAPVGPQPGMQGFDNPGAGGPLTGSTRPFGGGGSMTDLFGGMSAPNMQTMPFGNKIAMTDPIMSGGAPGAGPGAGMTGTENPGDGGAPIAPPSFDPSRLYASATELGGAGPMGNKMMYAGPAGAPPAGADMFKSAPTGASPAPFGGGGGSPFGSRPNPFTSGIFGRPVTGSARMAISPFRGQSAPINPGTPPNTVPFGGAPYSPAGGPTGGPAGGPAGGPGAPTTPAPNTGPFTGPGGSYGLPGTPSDFTPPTTPTYVPSITALMTGVATSRPPDPNMTFVINPDGTKGWQWVPGYGGYKG